MYIQAQRLRRIAAELEGWSSNRDAASALRDIYGIQLVENTDPEYLGILLNSIKRLPTRLVSDCLISRLGFEDMGESKEYYPNHGKYIDGGTLILNDRLLDDSSIDICEKGNKLNKFDQTLYHELGHGWDAEQGKSRGLEKDLSLTNEWLDLSGWSPTPIPGHMRMTIREKGMPELKDDWYYSPEAGFTRFYAKRNPWDDWADSFAYYVSDLKSFLPENKIQYFDKELSKYFKEQ